MSERWGIPICNRLHWEYPVVPSIKNPGTMEKMLSWFRCAREPGHKGKCRRDGPFDNRTKLK